MIRRQHVRSHSEDLLLFQSPLNVLKDLVSIMLFEISPEEVAPQVANSLKWNCKLCLILPPASQPIMPLGQSCVILMKQKMLIFLQLTSKVQQQQQPQQQQPQPEPLSIAIPLVYDISTNTISVAQKVQ